MKLTDIINGHVDGKALVNAINAYEDTYKELFNWQYYCTHLNYTKQQLDAIEKHAVSAAKSIINNGGMYYGSKTRYYDNKNC